MNKSILKDITDHRGSLVAIESKREIPFSIKRIYYMYNIKKGATRGGHAHKKLKQFLICINGRCTILLDDSIKKEEVVLSSKTEGLYLPPCVWHEIYDCSEDAIIISIANEYYDESDYIRDYDEFLKYIANNKAGLL